VPDVDPDRFREVLGPAECRRLLDVGSVGRLGFTHGALPAIVPVPYTMWDGTVLITARRGDPVVDATDNQVVAFEADEVDDDLRTGWSVTVVGPSRVSETAAGNRPGPAGHPGEGPRCYITVRPGLVRGWRESVAPPVPAPRSPAADHASRCPPVD